MQGHLGFDEATSHSQLLPNLGTILRRRRQTHNARGKRQLKGQVDVAWAFYSQAPPVPPLPPAAAKSLPAHCLGMQHVANTGSLRGVGVAKPKLGLRAEGYLMQLTALITIRPEACKP